MMKNKMTIKMNNKRSVISGEMIMVIPQLIFLIAVLFAFVILVKTLIITTVDVREIDASILVERMLFSPNGISYHDDSINRVYPGIINLEKFKEISMKTNKDFILGEDVTSILDTDVISYGPDNPPIIAAELILTQEGREDIIAFYNKKWYDRWAPKALGVPGPASIKEFVKERNVLIKEGNTLSPGTLTFVILS